MQFRLCLKKLGLLLKRKILQFFQFLPNALASQKIFVISFFQFFEKQTPKLAFWDLSNIKGDKFRKFGKRSPDLVTVADGFMVGVP